MRELLPIIERGFFWQFIPTSHTYCSLLLLFAVLRPEEGLLVCRVDALLLGPMHQVALHGVRVLAVRVVLGLDLADPKIVIGFARDKYIQTETYWNLSAVL